MYLKCSPMFGSHILIIWQFIHIKMLLIVNAMFVVVVRNSTDHQKILDEANGKHKMVLDKLNEERALLEVCF